MIICIKDLSSDYFELLEMVSCYPALLSNRQPAFYPDQIFGGCKKSSIHPFCTSVRNLADLEEIVI